MAKIKAPLFSLDASGSLDKTITYRNKPRDNTASKYAKPGDKNPFESSPRQKDQRSIIGLITACWQSKTNLDKLSWDTSAKAARFKGSGYHYFLHLAKTDLKTYLGLVGFWSMNYNVGDKIPDLSGNNNHGTLMPIYPCDCPQPVDSNNKKNGKAYSFDGIDDYINCGISHSLDFGTDIDFSVSFLFKYYSIDLLRILIQKGGSSVGKGFYLSISSSKLSITLNDSVNKTFYGSIPVSPNIWYLFTVTLDRISLLKIYLNGLYTGYSANISHFNDITSSHNLVFGGSSTHEHCGILDNIIFYNRVLSLEEIQRHYNLLI